MVSTPSATTRKPRLCARAMVPRAMARSLASLAMSVSNWDLRPAVPLRFVGLENFREMLGDPDFWSFLYNTVYMMAGIPVSIAGSLLLALVLNQRLRGVVVYRTMFYIPTITAGVALFVMPRLSRRDSVS